MDFNIGELKKMIGEMPDDAIIAGLNFGDKLKEFDYLKRILLLEKDGQKVIVFNPMGTHYFDLVEKEGYKYLQHWDELKPAPSPTGDRDCEELKERIRELQSKNYDYFMELKDIYDKHGFESIKQLLNL